MPTYSRQSSSASRCRASVSSGSSAGSVGSFAGGGHMKVGRAAKAGSSSFLVGRERDRSCEMELFSHQRKPRSNYRRPSNLGLSMSALPNKSEFKLAFQPKPSGRSHIVAKTPDHLKPEGSFVKESEVKASYRNMSPARPFIHKLQDHLKPEGSMDNKSETKMQYEDKKPQRPIIHKLHDHNEDVRPRGTMTENSEYRQNFAKVSRGDRVEPSWINNFAKVTIGGDASRQ